jgi:hypothetical protein
MADFVAVATLDQLAPGHAMTVTVRGVPVALFNVDGRPYMRSMIPVGMRACR